MLETHDPECVQHSDGFNTTVIDRVLLRQLSPKDKKWDDRRAETDRVRDLLKGTIYDALSTRISGCSGRLEFGFNIDDTGKLDLKLKSAWFCRVRTCPVCQWRRSLVWRAKAFKILPRVVEAYPNHRFIFLTLTVKNCQIADLRATLTKMNQAWMRLTKRKNWPAVGWLRSVEVTRGKDDTAHPHFHCLLMVTSGYFAGKNYLSQEAWTNLWKDVMKIEYTPIVNIKAVRSKNKDEDDKLRGILETLKYSVKPSDLIGDSTDKEITDKDREWLVELTKQLHKTRAVATGGILKEYLRELENEPDDLIHVNEEEETEDNIGASVIFDWQERAKKYLMNNDV